MRTPHALLALLAAALLGGCANDIEIRCLNDNQCLSGQSCQAGICRYLPQVPDGGTDASPAADAAPRTDAASGTDPAPRADAGSDATSAPTCGNTTCAAGTYCAAPGTCAACQTDTHCGSACSPCGGSRPRCDGERCVECTDNGHCPATAPCCVANLCVVGTCGL